MFDTTKKLDVTPQELEVIEAALHTQSKILNVQAGAGGNDARQRLNVVKSVLAQVAQQKSIEKTPRRERSCGWFGMARIFG